jgi:hypothetical protein
MSTEPRFTLERECDAIDLSAAGSEAGHLPGESRSSERRTLPRGRDWSRGSRLIDDSHLLDSGGLADARGGLLCQVAVALKRGVDVAMAG